ncbi:MAG: translation initiation factor IF-2 [Candidatus Marinimicrobia bacterium]|mgnify:FL=1|nr:translation initiation factor IF-2 [Candidatus Neomarinimicrobiota bacterium]|tara:strand:- start:5805 stop:8126 length:2322 start_codon:yes stop_codon:yes gene_type:complete
MPNKRIYQIAKELNISHNEIIKFLESNDVKVSNHMMPVDNNVYDTIMLEFSKEKKQVERQLKEKARKAISLNKENTKKEDEVIVDKTEKVVVEKDIKATDKTIDLNKVSEEKKSNQIKLDSEPIKSKDDTPFQLKKIDISEIADKIHKTNKLKQTDKKLSISQSLSSLKKKNKKKIKKKAVVDQDVNLEDNKSIKVPEFTSVDELARLMRVSAQDIIMKCIDLGLMVTINQRLDMDTIIMVADEFGLNVETQEVFKSEEDEVYIDDKDKVSRAPVVTIMGHVDHGKTSLLDFIRETNVIAGESGGITQHIGAYEVEVSNDKKITFIDTPGHEAFTAMRARGAQVTDVVVVIIAADDGVMPQTIEAIDHAKASGAPIIFAINKIDKPGADSEKVKKQLSEQNILVEEWGGKYQSSQISAKSGEGVDDLIEKILIESELLDLKAPVYIRAKGTIIESKLDKGQGPKATVLIQEGTLSKGDIFVCGDQSSKVREMLNERNYKISKALPSDPVQVLGFEKVPNAGEILTVFNDEREAKKIAQQRSRLQREKVHQMHSRITLEEVGKEISTGKVHDLNIIIKGDVDGSIEALSDSLMSLSNDEVNIKIILRSVGMVSENDVQLASTSQAIIVCFNVRSSVNAKRMAREFGVQIRYYSVIYEAIDEIKLALEGLLEPDIVEESIGVAEVRETFKIPKIGVIAGTYITQGKVIKNSLLRLKREGEVIFEGKLTSLKRFKEDVNEVLEGYECGIGIETFKEYKEKDLIEVYELKQVKRKLK